MLTFTTVLKLNSPRSRRDWRLQNKAPPGVFQLWIAAAVSVLAARELRSRFGVAAEDPRAVLRLLESNRRRRANARAGFSINDDPRFLFCCLFYPFSENT